MRNKVTTKSGTSLQNIQYLYDPVGNITSILDVGTGVPKEASYLYDDLDRLVRADINAGGNLVTETYTYSPIGNILSKSDVGAYAYGDLRHPHAVTSAGSYSFTYDTNGNLTNEVRNGENITYAYDYQNRLSSITNNTGQIAYSYGSGYNRVKKELPDGSSITYLGSLSEVDESGAFTNHFFADTLRIATANAQGLHYTTNDHLSSASIITDTSGTVVQKLDYLLPH